MITLAIFVECSENLQSTKSLTIFSPYAARSERLFDLEATNVVRVSAVVAYIRN
jgi:hypothetical protein